MIQKKLVKSFCNQARLVEADLKKKKHIVKDFIDCVMQSV